MTLFLPIGISEITFLSNPRLEMTINGCQQLRLLHQTGRGASDNHETLNISTSTVLEIEDFEPPHIHDDYILLTAGRAAQSDLRISRYYRSCFAPIRILRHRSLRLGILIKC
jgi:hypothetical protein